MLTEFKPSLRVPEQCQYYMSLWWLWLFWRQLNGSAIAWSYPLNKTSKRDSSLSPHSAWWWWYQTLAGAEGEQEMLCSRPRVNGGPMPEVWKVVAGGVSEGWGGDVEFWDFVWHDFGSSDRVMVKAHEKRNKKQLHVALSPMGNKLFC